MIAGPLSFSLWLKDCLPRYDISNPAPATCAKVWSWVSVNPRCRSSLLQRHHLERQLYHGAMLGEYQGLSLLGETSHGDLRLLTPLPRKVSSQSGGTTKESTPLPTPPTLEP